MTIKACTFDVFGTCVDWRNTVEDLLHDEMMKKKTAHPHLDNISEIAQTWRNGYAAYNKSVAPGDIPPDRVEIIDVVHWRILDDIVIQYKLESIWTEAELDEINLVWHRLKPLPDLVEGILALKKKCIVATLSNGNMRLQIDQAKFSNLQWDVLISGELFKSAKPNPAVYLGACKLLGLKPDEVCMVAAHKSDLEAAKKYGLMTACIARKGEEKNRTDPKELEYIDFVIETIGELADKI